MMETDFKRIDSYGIDKEPKRLQELHKAETFPSATVYRGACPNCEFKGKAMHSETFKQQVFECPECGEPVKIV